MCSNIKILCFNNFFPKIIESNWSFFFDDVKCESGVEVKDAPASWRDCVEGGAARMAYTRYADVVPTAYLEYDWTDLLP